MQDKSLTGHPTAPPDSLKRQSGQDILYSTPRMSLAGLTVFLVFLIYASKLGAALVRRGQLQEALEHLRIALRLKPDDVQTYRNLQICLALIKQGKK